MIDDRTPNLNLPLPHVDNIQTDDVERFRQAFTTLDSAVNGKQAALGFTPQNVAQKGLPNGYAALDADGKVPAGQLPSYVDDVIEVATAVDLPPIGVAGKIYITAVDGNQWRWSGSAYAQIVSSPGSTDAVPEGALNKYFTPERALAAVPAASSTVPGIVRLNLAFSTADKPGFSNLTGIGLKYDPPQEGGTTFAGGETFYNGLFRAGQVVVFLNGLRVSMSGILGSEIDFDPASLVAGSAGSNDAVFTRLLFSRPMKAGDSIHYYNWW